MISFAEQVKLVSDAANQVPVDVESLAQSLGIGVDEAFLEDNISGMLECHNGAYTITVNHSHSDTRKRFTVAHEIGHYMLHRSLIGEGIDDSIAYRSESGGKYHNTKIGPRQETQANKFAASLLMPTSQIRTHHATFRGDGRSGLQSMAELFNVSEASMRIRTEGMGLSFSDPVA